MKLNKWYNFGDIDHREHGLQAVRKTGENEFDIVMININPDFMPISDPWNSHEKAYNTIKRQYIVNSYTGFQLEEFDDGVLSFQGWEKTPNTDKEKAVYCTGYIQYHGGDCEIKIVSNYYKELRSYGIYRI